ncbi:hypothetical protein QAD02_000920 [Eretmocerus hayati]|uniref:Uncharacterized protein n=1 Tax=Eretmocerus hayati TaxID=131215 RepID=A0ACC2NFI9_9HYME|nr:hypothetical protein QAD02_000920 [Eretmocerus hayati]
MGKNKAQRTKNNARPSNSSRSAEFLGATAPSFTGFTSSKDGGCIPILPGLSLANNIEISNVDPNFQIVLKKMGKKDATTKYKALLEFSDMCKAATTKDVEAVLPFWPRIYTVLCTDSDHRVREAVQIAHATVVQKVGKAVATHLKQLSGPWFISQYDMYPPAASAASNSFNTTFPGQKFVNAIVHCQNEILNYICDNILVMTPQSLTTAWSSSPEEMESKYQRIVSSSLQAYCLYLRTVGPADIEKTADCHRKLIVNSKFWKLAKSEITIKTAFFNVLTALIRHASDFVLEDKKKVLTTVMNSMDEMEPVVSTAIWECLLLAVYKIEDWHSVVSIEKLVLPKLWKVLKNGGQYCANVIYPSLLPLVSQLTKLENKTSILTDFFENMREGLTAKRLKLSRSETQAMVASFIECLKYVILVQNSDVDFCKSLLKTQLMSMIEWCLTDENVGSTMRSAFFSEIAKLLRHWCRPDTSSTVKNCYPLLLSEFWNELESTLERLLRVEDDLQQQESTRRAQLVGPISDLLDCLRRGNIGNRSSLTLERRNSRKVRFAGEMTLEEEIDRILVKEKKLTEESEEDMFLEQLEKFIARLAVGQLKKLGNMKGEDERVRRQRGLAEIVNLIKGHESLTLFEALASVAVGEKNSSSSLKTLYESQIQPYLAGVEPEIAVKLIGLVLNLLSFMDEPDDKHFVLTSLQNIEDSRVKKTVVQCALTKKYRQDDVVREWCGQTFVTNLLLSTAQEVAAALNCTESVESMFVHAFEPMPDGGLIVSFEVITGISSTLSSIVDKMTWDSEKRVERIASLLSRLLNFAWSHKFFDYSIVELLKATFRLQVRNILEKGSDCDSNVNNIVEYAWTRGLQELSEIVHPKVLTEYVSYFSDIIWKNIFLTDDVLKTGLVELAINFTNAIINTKKDCYDKLLTKFLTVSDIRIEMEDLSVISLCAEIFSGDLAVFKLTKKSQFFNVVFKFDLTDDIREDDSLKILKWATVCAKILNDLLPDLPDLPEIPDIILNLSYAATLIESYTRYYNFSKNSNDIQASRKILHDQMDTLKCSIPEKVHEDVIEKLSCLLFKYGGDYFRVLTFYCDFFSLVYDPKAIFKAESPPEIDHELIIQAIQILGNWESGKKALLTIDGDNDLYKVLLSRTKLDMNEFVESSQDVFQRILNRQQMDPLSLLLDCEIHEALWQDLILPLEIILLFTKWVVEVPKQISLPQWDLINLCLASWILSIKKSLDHHGDFKVRAMIVSVSKLYEAVQMRMNIQAKEPTAELPPSLLDEWKNVFAAELQNEIFNTWTILAETYNKTDTSIIPVIPLNYLGQAIGVFSESVLKSSSSASGNTDESKVMATLLELINSPVPSIQLAAHAALNHAVNTLVEFDEAMIQAEGFDLSSLNIHKFEDFLKTNQEIVNTLLADFRLCDTESCTILPHTEPYTYTFGYLFLWDIVLKMCAISKSDLRYHYAEILKDEYFPNLLNTIFRLIPSEALLDNYSKSAKLIELFTTAPPDDFHGQWTEGRLSHMACWLYTNSLRYLPVLVRQWWSSAESRVSNAVDKITTCYVSQFLCNEDLNNNRLPNVDNMQVKVHASAREVVALYEMDDTKLELNISLPSNHPLGTVTVEPGQHVGGSANWRNCHMQLSLFLTHQNGSIWDGLLLWKSNLDKRFAGVEECYICFSVFHISTYQIPQLSCQTCRKTFHKPCLYKWFSTSHKSTCPICRNVF